MNWRAASRTTRDLSAAFFAVAFSLWLGNRVVARAGLWIPAGSIALLFWTGRALMLRAYGPPNAVGDGRLAWLTTGVLFASGVLFVVVITSFHSDAGLAAALFGMLLPVYAWGLFFYRRRVLSRLDLESTRQIVQGQLEAVGDSTEHGQRLKELIAALGEQVRRWEP